MEDSIDTYSEILFGGDSIMEMNEALDRIKEAADNCKESVAKYVKEISKPKDLKQAAIQALEVYHESITDGVSDIDRLKAQQGLSDEDVTGILNSVPEFLRSGLSDYETVAKYYADYLTNQGRAPRASVDENMKKVLSMMNGASEAERVMLALNLLK